MCGICGWIDWDREMEREGGLIQVMTDRLIPRGPDNQGAFLSSRAALGHRRLIVVDPEGGGQPMRRNREGRSCTIVYNGELYNTAEIRKELETRGWAFKSRNSDTEAVLLAYMEWGPECLEHFNGIFALAVWDEAHETLFMARDRLGVKPLFYYQQGSTLLFASELKSLLAHPYVKPVLDESGLAEIMVMGPSRTPGHGIFKRVQELRPGYCLTFTREGSRVVPYWRLKSWPHEDDLLTSIEVVKALLQDAVYRQIQADVPVAAFLSGGLDSSAITALAIMAARSQGGPGVKSFSVDYAGSREFFQTSPYQRDADFMWVDEAASVLGSHHRSVTLDNRELADALEEALLANDYPGMADIDSSLLLFCREVKKEVTVALSGECADEIFGGYPWFHWEDMGVADFPWVRGVEQRLEFLNPELGVGIKQFCRDYLDERYKEAVREVPELPGEGARDAHKRRLFYLCLTRFMPTLLDRKDRMSMASGLEVRVPFADHRLLEYVWNVPWDMKNCDRQSKGLLRRALRGIVPQFILDRPKSPYPKTHNPQYLNLVRERALSILEDKNSPAAQWLHIDMLRKVIKEEQPLFSRPFFGQLMADAQYFAWIIQLNNWLGSYSVKIQT